MSLNHRGDCSKLSRTAPAINLTYALSHHRLQDLVCNTQEKAYMAQKPPHSTAPCPMSVEAINEPVEVRVDFCARRVIPRVMNWNNKNYPIRSVNMIHSTRHGASKLFLFSVSDRTNYFKLQLDTDNLEWRLLEMYAE